MSTFRVPVIQYLMPHGDYVWQETDLPDEFHSIYLDMISANFRFETEILQTGQVSMSITNKDGDADISITSNDSEVQKGMCDMLARMSWKNKQPIKNFD